MGWNVFVWMRLFNKEMQCNVFILSSNFNFLLYMFRSMVNQNDILFEWWWYAKFKNNIDDMHSTLVFICLYGIRMEFCIRNRQCMNWKWRWWIQLRRTSNIKIQLEHVGLKWFWYNVNVWYLKSNEKHNLFYSILIWWQKMLFYSISKW